jgi:hypothetical protein
MAQKLPEPIFTPATKADMGDHDENIDYAAVEKLVGAELAPKVKDTTLRLYREAAAFARVRGIIIADTKFEFGRDDEGRLHLIDEVLTPDSSRFWPADRYKPGSSPPSFDKQFVRDYLETLDWNKKAPGPKLPRDIIEKTAANYREALTRLTGIQAGLIRAHEPGQRRVASADFRGPQHRLCRAAGLAGRGWKDLWRQPAASLFYGVAIAVAGAVILGVTAQPALSVRRRDHRLPAGGTDAGGRAVRTLAPLSRRRAGDAGRFHGGLEAQPLGPGRLRPAVDPGRHRLAGGFRGDRRAVLQGTCAGAGWP